MRRLRPLTLVLCLLALALPGTALAQNPFTPLPQAAPDTTTTQVVTTNASSSTVDNGGLKRWQEILIFLGGVALLAGIAGGIYVDARRRAPVAEGELVGATPGQGSHKHVAKQRQRKKATAARKARRANR
jgi:hypothetical protein